MAGRVVHPTLTGPNLIREIALGIAFGFIVGGIWKMEILKQRRETKHFYEMLDKGQVSVVAEE